MPGNTKVGLLKKLALPLLATVLIVCGVTGCSSREVDTAKLQTAFQSADPGIRTELDQGIADVKAGDYPGALKVMRHIAFAAKLDKDQRAILQDSIKKVSAKIK